MEKVFLYRIFKLCDAFIKVMKFNGQCLLNCHGALLRVTDDLDPDKRSFYEKEAINSGWSTRELKRQISTSLYERLLLSEGKTNKETVLALAEKGIEMSTPLDIIKDPYVFEFLGVPENKPMLESDLEKALVAQIEKFLGIRTRFYVCGNATAYYIEQYSLLCGYGFL